MATVRAIGRQVREGVVADLQRIELNQTGITAVTLTYNQKLTIKWRAWIRGL